MATPNFQNRTLYHGDNLNFLRGMNSETVHLIATDPPFNKSRDFHATPDSLTRGASFQGRWSWRDDIHDEWLLEIQRDHPDVWSVINTAKRVYGDDMGAFLRLCSMRSLARAVLRMPLSGNVSTIVVMAIDTGESTTPSSFTPNQERTHGIQSMCLTLNMLKGTLSTKMSEAHFNQSF